MFKSALKLFSGNSKKGESLPCSVISSEPIVLISFWHDFNEYFDRILGPIPDHKRAYMIIMFNHNRVSADRARMVKEDVGVFKLRYPNVDFLFLCNSSEEQGYFNEVGLQSIHCHAAAFLDESLYQIESSTRKDFDAVYRGDITPHNRHELAGDIDKLLLVGDYKASNGGYFKEVMDQLQTAKFVKGNGRIDSYLTRAEVGLCLGDYDGDVFSCVEYLLSGLKVVTTDTYVVNTQFYDDEYVSVTRAFSSGVNKSVKDMKKRQIDPYIIRERTLKILSEHRQRFINVIQDKYDRQGSGRSFSKEWSSVFTHLFSLNASADPKSKGKSRLLKDNATYA